MKKTSSCVVLFSEFQAEHLCHQLEERTALALINSGIQQQREKIGAAGGRVIKTIGRLIMAVFPDVANAAATSIAMQRGMAALALAWPRGSQLGIGFAWGEVDERQDGDVFGDTVSYAARAYELAGARRILATGESVDQLGLEQRAACRLVHTINNIKGKTVKLEYFELPWD